MRVPTGGIDKIDLVFSIDNSASMTDKQELLKAAVPSLLSRFLNPLCVDDERRPTGKASVNGRCEQGKPEFPPVADVHIAVVSSSLGSAGAKLCQGSPDDGKAQLLPKARPEAQLASWANSGFLAWDPSGTRNVPPGQGSSEVQTQFQNLVTAVGESGCGYEASLESWYRFLISPDPPETVSQGENYTVSVSGVDAELLRQRDQFLRSDSLVAIVMLTDENDCSIRSSGQGAMVAGVEQGQMPMATSACVNPNDPCCRPCGIDFPAPSDCTPSASDPACSQQHTSLTDPVNLRCAQQKRRFGIDLLEPTEKYVQGLTLDTVPDRNGKAQPNPLFVARHGAPPRNPSLVYLAGIVGVPWQDIATEDSLSGPNLRYMNAQELRDKGRWNVILGDPAKNQPPTDPHLLETALPRTGTHPFLPGATIAPPESNSPRSDVISGHEQRRGLQDDLQYACIFELATPRNCSETTRDCDCKSAVDVSSSRALCQPPGGGPAGNTQYFAKAYPGLRQLEVLRGIGPQAIVASICPKVTASNNPESDPSFGYNPAVDALITAIGAPLASQCLARAPEVDSNGQTRCVVLEANLTKSCDCGARGRRPPNVDALGTVQKQLKNDELCDGPLQPRCEDVCACEIDEAQGDALSACRSVAEPGTQAPGYCYVDPDHGLGDPLLVKDCPSTQRKLLRFVGERTPMPGSIAFMSCFGATVTDP